MTFLPNLQQIITINKTNYSFGEHPFLPGHPYGSTGKRGTVYKLIGGNENQALKVFVPIYREPRMVSVAEKLNEFASFKGLKVAKRSVLTGSKDLELLKEYKDLTYAVVMPWIEGETWSNFISLKKPLMKKESLAFSKQLISILLSMEENGIAHCDISGANLIFSEGKNIELIDLEEMYGSEFKKPKKLPAGSPGYAHITASEGLWSEEADRFSGAIMISEMLGFSSLTVRENVWDDTFFKPDEIQKDCERYGIIKKDLHDRWGKSIGDLFSQAWYSDSLLNCPNFSEWMINLPEEVEEDNKPKLINNLDSLTMVAIPQSNNYEQWKCRNCGKFVLISIDVCPYCESDDKNLNTITTAEIVQKCPKCGTNYSDSTKVCKICNGVKKTTYYPSPPKQNNFFASIFQSVSMYFLRWIVISIIVSLIYACIGLMNGS